MAQNKEQLNKLLQFIKRLIDEPGNEDFVRGLRELLDVPLAGETDNVKLNDIEKYLGLDYKLDSSTPDIDFSFIKEPFVLDQLTSDYREMLRYRYGVRSHKIDFSEFCRYAMLQVEQLLNYFYLNKFQSTEDILKYIAENAKWANVEKIDSIKSLSLAVKLSAFAYSNHMRGRDCLDFVKEIRNAQSHRNTEREGDNIHDFRNQLAMMGLPLTKEGEVFKKGIMNNEMLQKKFESIDKASYWRYRFQLWRLREPFDDVLGALKELTQILENELNYQH